MIYTEQPWADFFLLYAEGENKNKLKLHMLLKRNGNQVNAS